MATIPITPDLRLKSDPYCRHVQRRSVFKTGKRAGETEWRSELYFSSFSAALQALPELELRVSKAESVEAALEELQAFSKQLSEAFRGAITLDLESVSE